MVFIDIDVHSVGVAKEVVHVAQNLLISTHEEHAQIVGFSFLECVHWQAVSDALGRDEVGNLAVAVAGDVLHCCTAGGLLVEALQWHHGEHLVDSP